MRKLIIVLLVVLISTTGCIGYIFDQGGNNSSNVTVEDPEDEETDGPVFPTGNLQEAVELHKSALRERGSFTLKVSTEVNGNQQERTYRVNLDQGRYYRKISEQSNTLSESYVSDTIRVQKATDSASLNDEEELDPEQDNQTTYVNKTSGVEIRESLYNSLVEEGEIDPENYRIQQDQEPNQQESQSFQLSEENAEKIRTQVFGILQEATSNNSVSYSTASSYIDSSYIDFEETGQVTENGETYTRYESSKTVNEGEDREDLELEITVNAEILVDDDGLIKRQTYNIEYYEKLTNGGETVYETERNINFTSEYTNLGTTEVETPVWAEQS